MGERKNTLQAGLLNRINNQTASGANLPAPQQSQADESVVFQIAGQPFSRSFNDSDSNLHPGIESTRQAPYYQISPCLDLNSSLCRKDAANIGRWGRDVASTREPSIAGANQ